MITNETHWKNLNQKLINIIYECYKDSNESIEKQRLSPKVLQVELELNDFLIYFQGKNLQDKYTGN